MNMDIRKAVGLALGSAFLATSSFSALAEVDVFGYVNKEENVYVNEDVTIDKNITLDVHQKAAPDNSSEARTVKNDENYGNTVTDDPNTFNANIDTNAFDGAAGVIGVNQSPGYVNNQGNATSVAMASDGDAFVHGSSSVGLRNYENYLESFGSERNNNINTAFGAAAGVIGVNQSAGHMNNQDNGVAVSLGIDSIAALSEADLGMYAYTQNVNDADSNNTDTISGAFMGATGVIGVNQSSGSLNNQANVVSIAATSFAGL